MGRNAWLYRCFFIGLSCLIAVLRQYSIAEKDLLITPLAIGLSQGLLIFLMALVAEITMKNLNLRLLNTIILGLFTGALLGYVLTVTAANALNLLTIELSQELHQFILLGIYLGSIYFSVMVVSSTQENFWLSIPFIRFTPGMMAKKKEIVLDMSALEDPRLMELARNNLLDYQLVIPTFIIKEIQKGLDAQDESIRMKSRKCQEHLKRLETMAHLGLQQKEFHFSEQEDFASKIARAARLLQGYIITAEQISYRQEEEGLTIINLENIASSLKPGAQRGEVLLIKIQRLGKEPKQGVGYLEDGTMVVVNGGGEFLGQTVKTQVLSQKYSSSGKIIFCNALTEEKSGARAFQTALEASPYHQFSYSGNSSST